MQAVPFANSKRLASKGVRRRKGVPLKYRAAREKTPLRAAHGGVSLKSQKFVLTAQNKFRELPFTISIPPAGDELLFHLQHGEGYCELVRGDACAGGDLFDMRRFLADGI